jgi:hypothetical protein
MNRYSLPVALALLLCVSCSDYRDNDWQPGDAIYRTSPPGRIHGDERSQQQRYSDCISGTKRNDRAAQRHCAQRSRTIDPDYHGITMPLYF